MKYYNTPLEDQETLVNVLYKEQIIRIYSTRTEVIKNLTDKIGEPTTRIKRSKSYWAAASWDIDFSNTALIKRILSKDIFIDEKFEYKKRKKKIKSKEEFYQVSIDNI